MNNWYLRSGSCDRFAARPSASANLTPSSQANLAQTTVGDVSECSLAGGFTPRPGLVASRRARSKSSSSRHRPFAALSQESFKVVEP